MESLSLGIDFAKLNQTILCYAQTIYRFNGLWEGPDPLNPLISFFFIQLIVSITTIHLGIFLGPSVLGRLPPFRKIVFPTYSFKVLEPMAQFAISFYAFLIGLKMDARGLRRTGQKQMKIALAGIVVPFSVGTGMYFIFEMDELEKTGWIFWGAALTVTGFSTLTKILDMQQILHTEIGKTAVGAASVNEFCAWGLLAVALAVSSSPMSFYWSIICTAAYLVLCTNYVRPTLNWIISKTPEAQGYSEFYLCSILSGAIISGVITDWCGTHPMIGMLIFGLLIPNEMLEATIVDKLEDFVVGILMPVYYVVCGLRTNVDAIGFQNSWFLAIFVILIVCFVKLLSTLTVVLFCDDLSVEEAAIVGVLSSVKGVMVLFILESGEVQGSLSTQTYTIMIIASLVMTMVVTPAINWLQPMQHMTPYKRRTVQNAKPEEELRILACIYNTSNVPSLISLLRSSNSSIRSPISVFALQIVELVGRATTMMITHNARKVGPRNPNQMEAEAEQIITAFDEFALKSEGVRTLVMTARSSYSTMDMDICNVAGEKRTSLIIIPFHKQQAQDGEMEDMNPDIRNVNESVLVKAPCSVGILIDKGFASESDRYQSIVMLYFGGPDDREALSYARRMVKNGDATLSVVRFIASFEAAVEQSHSDQRYVSLGVENQSDKHLDEEYLSRFKVETMENKSVSYTELVLNDEEEAIKAIKSMDEDNYHLYVVGRGSGMDSPLTSGLADWCDCPELGPIGDLLVTSEFESAFAVLIVQQYDDVSASREGSILSSNSMSYGEEVAMRPSIAHSDGFESLRNWDHEA